jgi:hypothetical protein
MTSPPASGLATIADSSWQGEGVSLFASVSAEDMRAAQIVTGATMAAFIGVGLVPGLRAHAVRIRAVLLAAFLLACGVLVGHALMR